MAFSAVTERGSTSTKTSGASVAVSPSANITAGKIAFAVLAFDNIATTDGASTTQDTLTDTDGHTWTKVYEQTNTAAGVAADGVGASLWWTKATSTIGTGDTITAAFDSAIDAKVIGLFEVTIGAGTIQLAASDVTLDDVTNPDARSLTGLSSGTEYLILGIRHSETNTLTWTEDAAFTNVYAAEGIGTTGGAQASNVSLSVGYLITSGITSVSFDVAAISNTQHVIALLAFEETGGASPQGLTGTLFTKAPTFSTGAITSVRNLAGVLLQKAPAFSTGAITSVRNLAGVLFQKAPTFFAGAFDAGPAFLTGTLFAKAPSFFVGGIIESQALAGVLFQKAPTFSQGAITIGAAPLDGVLFQRAPTFFQGTIAAGAVNLGGTTFTKAPTFFAGTVTPGEAPVDGELFENAPVFFSGVLFQQGGPQPLGGDLFVKAPTFPQGAITTGAVNLDGVLFQSTPTFNVGAIASTYDLSGVLYQNAPVFPQGEVIGAQLLEGVLFQSTPVFGTGSIGVAGAIDGVLFQNTPVFFTGSLGQVGGSFWRPNPAGYTLNPAAFDPVLRNEVPPWAIEVHGEEFELVPSFFAGSMS